MYVYELSDMVMERKHRRNDEDVSVPQWVLHVSPQVILVLFSLIFVVKESNVPKMFLAVPGLQVRGEKPS